MRPLEKLKNSQRDDSPRKWKCLFWMWKVHTDSKETAQIQYSNPLWFNVKTKFDSDNHKSTESCEQLRFNHEDHLVQLSAKSKLPHFSGTSMKIAQPLSTSCSLQLYSKNIFHASTWIFSHCKLWSLFITYCLCIMHLWENWCLFLTPH